MRNTIKYFFAVNPCTTQISFSFLAVLKNCFIDHKLVFATIRNTSTSFLFYWKEIVFPRCEYVLSIRTDVRSLQVVERQVIGRQYLGSFVSLLLAIKYVVPQHIHLGAFSGFYIISFNNLVNVKCDVRGHLTKSLGLCQFQVISISGTWSMLP